MNCNGTDLVSIGKRIEQIRKKCGLTQQELAEKLFCKREIISYYENGSRDIKTATLIELSKVLNVTTDYLLGLSNVETTDPKVKEICDYTGLSEEAIIKLHKKVECEKEYPNYDSFLEYLNIFIIYGLPNIYDNLNKYICSLRYCGYLEKIYSNDFLKNPEGIVLNLSVTGEKVVKPRYSEEELEARNDYQKEKQDKQPLYLFNLQKAFVNFIEEYGEEIADTTTVENYEKYADEKNNSIKKLLANLSEATNNFVDVLNNNEAIKEIAKMQEMIDKMSEKDGENNGNDK